MNQATIIYGGDLKTTAAEYSKKFNPADVFYLTPKEDAKSIQVAETKDFVSRAHLAPVGDSKLFIISDASLMTIPAQNKLLKTLEDLPAKTMFLLLASKPSTILNTVKSRCVALHAKIDENRPSIPPEVLATVEKVFKIKPHLQFEKNYAILSAVSEVQKRVLANCNAQNQADLIIMEILKNAKNS